MSLKFNIDRPKISDEEIKKNQNFNELVERFKQQSLKQAQGDESWWKNKKIRYSALIAGVTVICTITYLSLFTNSKQKTKTNETLITQNTSQNANKKESKTSYINNPSQKLKIPYTSYKINNAKGGQITHNTSTKIKVPKNSFVDKNGKDIIGDVTIEYKEFHDAGDIILSGIPMTYDSAGITYNFESAGMFDIKGNQNGEPVFIKPEKNVEVQLASTTKEERFNQYYLDTLKKNWQCLKKDKAIEILKTKPSEQNEKSSDKTAEFQIASHPKLSSLKYEIEKVIPRKIDSVKVVYSAKASKLPKAKEPLKPAKLTPGKPSFKLDGSYDEFPELSVFNNVVFEVGSENKNYTKELHEITWSDVKISQGPVKGKNYVLNLMYRNRSEKLIVYPVLTGNDFDEAQKVYEQKLGDYQKLADKRDVEEKRLISEMQAKQAAYLAEQRKKQEAYDLERSKLLAKYNLVEQNEIQSNFNAMSLQVRATRLFSVSQFGIYNSDCPHTPTNASSVVPIFVSQEKGKILQPTYIYLVNHTLKIVTSLDKQTGFRIDFDPNNEYSICIFNNNKMYVCDKQLFKKTKENENNKFMVKPLPESTDNVIDFKKALEI